MAGMCSLDTAMWALSAVFVVLLYALAFDAAAGEYRPRQLLGLGLLLGVSETRGHDSSSASWITFAIAAQ